MRAFGLFLFVLILGCIGVACLFFAAQVQRWAIKSVEQGPTGRIHALMGFVRSSSYPIAVRAVGIIALLMAGLLLWAQIRNR